MPPLAVKAEGFAMPFFVDESVLENPTKLMEYLSKVEHNDRLKHWKLKTTEELIACSDYDKLESWHEFCINSSSLYDWTKDPDAAKTLGTAPWGATVWPNPVLRALAQNNNLAEMEEKLTAGEDPNQADTFHMTPIAYASQRGFKEMVRLLIAHGANVNVESKFGFTPIYMATAMAEFETLAILKDEGGARPSYDVARSTPELEVSRYAKVNNNNI